MKVSIITINYNNATGLKRTIESVLYQTYKNIEYIVIDGGSTDASVEIIKQNASNINYWVSEPDNGVYHAQNKGIEKSMGDYLLFLNSGDYFIDNTVLSKSIDYNLDKDIVYGDLYLKYPEIGLVLKNYPEKVSLDFFINNESLPHPATFINKNLFRKVGFYNEELRIVSDWEFWLKSIFIHRATYKKVPVTIAAFNTEGISSRSENQELVELEKEAIYQKYFAGIIEDYRKFYAERSNINSNIFIRILRKLNLLPRRF